MTKKEKEAKRQDAIVYLRGLIRPGERVYTTLQHRSASGMSRRIRAFVPTASEHEPNGMTIRDISYWTALACGFRFNEDKCSIVVGGAGMDMGYHIVYSLSSALYRDNFYCIGLRCPSNDHTNDRDGSWSRDDKKNIGRKHSDGGYSLTHSWL